MDTARSDSGGWDCPACDRRVPGRIRACRCGFEQPGAEAPAESPASGSKPWAAGLPLLAVGLVLGAALSLYPWQKAPPAAPASTAAARATSVVHVPTAAEPPPVETADDAEQPDPAPDPDPTIEQPDAPKLEDLVSRVVPAVAFILAGQNRGTGFFIARDKVLTNAHVVGGQSSIRLQVGDANYTARVVSVSTGSDLAVLQVYNASATQAVLTLGSVSGARVGEEVIAVGSALGVLSNTVTRGIVSAVRKAGSVTLIQTDAAINPGNSGGPLVNRAGQVIGINSLRAGQQAEGVAFAVAIDHATQLLNGERVTDTQTPLGSLTQMLDGRSDGDQQRARGEQEYGRILEAAGRAAAELDSLWERYAPSCVTATTTPAGDRPWFAVYASGAVRVGTSSTVDCPRWYEAMKSRAEAFRVEVEKAAELARQRGVFPGTARDLRRRYRLQWSGWDR